MKEMLNDIDLILYVNDRLSKQNKRKIEKQAIENHETDVLLNCIIANYTCQQEYADELLGFDDFVVGGAENVIEEVKFEMPTAADKKNRQ